MGEIGCDESRSWNNNKYANTRYDCGGIYGSWNRQLNNRTLIRKVRNGKRLLPPTSLQYDGMSSSFKSLPSVCAASFHRPYAARCCSCLPGSCSNFYEDSMKEAGISNVLFVQEAHTNNYLLTRSFCHAAYAWNRTTLHKYPDVSVAVLQSQRLAEAIQKRIQNDADKGELARTKSIESARRYAKSVLSRMKAKVSNIMTRFTGWFLQKFLSTILSRIIVHNGQMHLLRKASKESIPLVYLPTHASHLDYILITFVLFSYDIPSPHVAAGDNLSLPLFGFLMRSLGGYFIRRRLDGNCEGKDYVYRAVLHSYMEELMRRGENFEFFVEGGRTRSGKPLYPKGGLLSVLTDSIDLDVVRDIFIVPVSISYDKIVDGNFANEQMGKPKQRETFWGACKAIWNVIVSHYGGVRLDFAQPFSLKEYMHSAARNPHLSPRSSSGEVESPVGSTQLLLKRESSVQSNDSATAGGGYLEQQQRLLIQGLAEHIVHDCARVRSFMSTHVLAFLLLVRHRNGASVETLAASFDNLKELVLLRGHDLGFCGKTTDVIRQACQLLGDGMVQIVAKNVGDDSSQTTGSFVVPNTTLPAALELAYYSNGISTAFVFDSVVAIAILSHTRGHAELASVDGLTVSFSRESVIQRASRLCSLLKYEYIFAPSCTSVDFKLSDTLDFFTACELIQLEDGSGEYSAKRRWRNDFEFGNDENEDEGNEDSYEDVTYYLNGESNSVTQLRHWAAVVGPLIEAYYVTACNLTRLQEPEHGDMKEELFLNVVLTSLVDRATVGVATYAESASMDTVKNAVNSFRNFGVLEQYTVDSVRKVGLSRAYKSGGDELDKLIAELSSFHVVTTGQWED